MTLDPLATFFSFETDNFRVVAEAEPETLHPADCFDPTCHDIDRICRDIDRGEYLWFTAVIRVLLKVPASGNLASREVEVGYDYLGGCLYEDTEEFRQDQYFYDMVREAVHDARRSLDVAVEALS